MCADVDFPISLRTHYSTPPALIVSRLKRWLERQDTTCLVHPLGFWIVLLSRSETEEWRFHFWPPGETQTTGMPAMIHTHDRVVESRVILGTVNNTLYKEVNAESGGLPVYEVSYGGDKFVRGTSNILRNTGQLVTVTPTVKQALGVGDRYRVGAHTYHRAVVESHGAAATIVRMHAPVPGPPKVLGLPGFPDQITFPKALQIVGGTTADDSVIDPSDLAGVFPGIGRLARPIFS